MFILVNAAVDPLQDLRESTAVNKAQQIEARIAQLDLETNVVIRFFRWIGHFVTGDWGVAWRSGQDVRPLIGDAIGSTLELVTAATFLALILGVFVGIVSALRQYSTFDYLIIFVSFLLYSLPSFWVAVLLKQWGAIGFNDFLRDPRLAWPVLIASADPCGAACRPSWSRPSPPARCSPTCRSRTGGTTRRSTRCCSPSWASAPRWP
jgi:peptide/nickel transport system permease protein